MLEILVPASTHIWEPRSVRNNRTSLKLRIVVLKMLYILVPVWTHVWEPRSVPSLFYFDTKRNKRGRANRAKTRRKVGEWRPGNGSFYFFIFLVSPPFFWVLFDADILVRVLFGLLRECVGDVWISGAWAESD